MRQLKPSRKRRLFEAIGGRAGISATVICEVENFIKNPTYKGAARLAGKLRLLAELCESDEYWKEKMQSGYYGILEKLEILEDLQCKK